MLKRQARKRHASRARRVPFGTHLRETSMKALLAALLVLSLAALAAAQAEQAITVMRIGTQPSVAGGADHFTGPVRVDSRFSSGSPARISGGSVTFEPGSRTAWHTHPLGQTLIVTSGVGWVQSWGGDVQEIKPGDVVRIPPGVKHWHGASATAGMTHIAIAETLEGTAVVWMEKVSDEQYREGR